MALLSHNDVLEWSQAAGRAKPFLRWAGGKVNTVQLFESLVPRFNGRYVEPFLGGGSMFFWVTRRRGIAVPALLGDTNRYLIAVFRAVQTDARVLADRLEALQDERIQGDPEAHYYEIRQAFNRSIPNPDPAHFIYLNRTCWNALWRVNQAGEFNVPYGAPKNDRIMPTLDQLTDVSASLALARFRATSWENTIAAAEPGDFVYLDPPYFSDHVSSDRKYSVAGFGPADHERLANAAMSLAERGIDFLLSNSSEREMVDLYRSRGLNVFGVSVRRSISSKSGERSRVTEIVVTPPDTKLTVQDVDECRDLQLLGQRELDL